MSPLSSPLIQVANAGGQHHSDSLTPLSYIVNHKVINVYLFWGDFFLEIQEGEESEHTIKTVQSHVTKGCHS